MEWLVFAAYLISSLAFATATGVVGYYAGRRSVRGYLSSYPEGRDTLQGLQLSGQEINDALAPPLSSNPADVLAHFAGLPQDHPWIERWRRYCGEVTFIDLERDEPLDMPPPPNIGGEGRPPYRGPNYTEAEDLADELKGLRHYGTDKEA